MGQYVMEFTSESVETILTLLDQVVVKKKSIQTLDCAEQSKLQFRPARGELKALLPDLAGGRLCSVMVNSEESIRYGLLTCPRFNGQELSQWMGTIEFETDTWRPVLERILKDHNVTAACVGLEEGIDLTDKVLTIANFPWEDPFLLAGALRQVDGSWERREN